MMWTEEVNQRKTSESWQLHASYVRDEEVSPCDVSVTPWPGPVSRAVWRHVTRCHELTLQCHKITRQPLQCPEIHNSTKHDFYSCTKTYQKNKHPAVENDCDTSKPFHLHACLRCWMDRACEVFLIVNVAEPHSGFGFMNFKMYFDL